MFTLKGDRLKRKKKGCTRRRKGKEVTGGSVGGEEARLGIMKKVRTSFK